jgi:hypothetical protein
MRTRLLYHCPDCQTAGIPVALWIELNGKLTITGVCIPCNKLFVREYDVMEVIITQQEEPATDAA